MYNGRTGTSHFVHYREVILSLKVKMYYHYRQVHYWCIEKCPLYRGYLYCVLFSEGPLSEVPLSLCINTFS